MPWFSPAPILAQGFQQFGTQGNIAVTGAFALADVQDHALTIDVTHLKQRRFGATYPSHRAPSGSRDAWGWQPLRSSGLLPPGSAPPAVSWVFWGKPDHRRIGRAASRLSCRKNAAPTCGS